MKPSTTLLVCPLIAAKATVIPRSGPAPPGPWTAGVWKIAQGTDVFFWGNPINANNGKFWVNKNTTSYCPSGIEGLDCSAYPGTDTVFAGGNGTLSMNVGVPGGQQGEFNLDSLCNHSILNTLRVSLYRRGWLAFVYRTPLRGIAKRVYRYGLLSQSE